MYVIHQKLKGKPHRLSNALLLSPAGIHSSIPIIVRVFGWIIVKMGSRFTDHFALPNFLIDIMNKIHKDVKSLPATNDLMTYISSRILGGKSIGESPIAKSAKILSSMLLFGFPTNLVEHFYTCLYREQKFQAFNFGSKEKNLAAYGTEQPLNYLENYHLIDIDVNYFISMNDFLIRADDIIEHYNTLKKHHQDKAHLKVFEGYSHIDFTYQSHHDMISEILTTLKDNQNDEKYYESQV